MQTKTENSVDADLLAIRKLADDFLTAYNAANLERVCALLSEGAVLMPPNEPAIAGLESVKSRIESFFSGFTFTLKLEPQQSDVIIDLAFERGAYAAYALLKGDKGEPRGGYGEYLLLFERQFDGTWRIAAFGTAAAQGAPPQSVIAPERLAEVVAGSPDYEAAYWRDKWADTLSEHYSSAVPSDIRERLDK
jgi:ketosteroid isomerase-like protein